MTEYHGIGRPLKTIGDCRLYADKGSHAVNNAGIRNVFWGVRSVMGGQYENQRFTGTRKECEAKFEEWARTRPMVKAKTKDKEAKKVSEPVKKVPVEQAKEQRLPSIMYALAYKRGNTVKYVMAFNDEDAAIDAADALCEALDVAGVDGDYTVDELKVRWS